MKRLLLEYEDFEKLTKGEIIQKDGVEIALSDIGYYNMIEIIEHNLRNENESDKEINPDFLYTYDHRYNRNL